MWTGWPIFDVRICQFEKDQWMAAYDKRAEDEGEEQWPYDERHDNAEEGLLTVSGWNRT